MSISTVESWLIINYSYLWHAGVVVSLVCLGLIENRMPLRQYVCPIVKRHLTNLSLLVINISIQRMILPIFPLVAALYAQESQQGLFNQLSLHPIIGIILSFLILDLFGYWLHKVMHFSTILWRVHRAHHSDIDFDVTTGLRFHPFEAILTAFLDIALVFLFGIPVVAIILFSLFHVFTGLFTHLNVHLPQKLDTFIRLFIVTPDMHRIHHSAHIDESSSNYGIVFPFWDRLFKTYTQNPAQGHEAMELGLKEKRDPAKLMLLEFLLLPFRLRKD